MPRRVNRTDAQMLANNIDRDVYRWLADAERMAAETRSQNWHDIVEALRRLSHRARLEMHRDDLKAM